MKIFKSEQSRGAMSADFSALRSEELLKRCREEQRWGPANGLQKISAREVAGFAPGTHHPLNVLDPESYDGNVSTLGQELVHSSAQGGISTVGQGDKGQGTKCRVISIWVPGSAKQLVFY